MLLSSEGATAAEDKATLLQRASRHRENERGFTAKDAVRVLAAGAEDAQA